MHRKHLSKILLIITILSVGIGSLALTKSEFFRQLEQSQKLYHWVNREIMSRYVDDIDIEAFTKKSIQNMLSELDPYTVYLEAEERDGLDMLTNGKYGGVGIQIGKRDDKLTVIAPMDNTPAQRAGIISGDRIIAIDEKSTAGLNLDDAAKLIRGKKGTVVVLTIERASETEPIDFSLTRSDIEVQDVAYFGMLNDEVGYIRLTRFSKNAAYEIREAIRGLNQDTESIILDLRDNPGGLLQSAISVLDLFIDKGEVLLTTKGKHKESNRTYKSNHKPLIDSDVQIAVLINEGSASASEIVAGAIQDLDRGVILGKRSFGKGLVQSVYNFDNKRSLKITTAKYYIPSGRLIQKPDYNNEEIIAWTATEDSIFTTVGGRSVRGGGGIHPDVEIANEIKPSTLVQESWRKGMFFSFVQNDRDRFHDLEEIKIDDEILGDFREFLATHDLSLPISGESQLNDAHDKLFEIDSTNTEMTQAFENIFKFIKLQEEGLFDSARDQIALRLKMEYANILDGTAGRIKINLEDDPVIVKTLSVLENHTSYEDIFVIN
ncbi:MAG: PDZ domain-containing protein [Candidatus Marinimicrobia bacterium]|nr:PDZ domain-containing protein [Candidatus Neomarinimicrobiota bacterium]